MESPQRPDILESIDVPETLRRRWQDVLTLLAELLTVPASLVMRVHADEIEVFARGQREGNVYEEGERAHLDTGLYCETVMATRSELSVPDARKDPAWDHNPDISLGMVSYLGFPLEWPSGHMFGTICVLDTSERRHSDLHRRLLAQFRDLIQNDLALVFENHLLKQEVAERETVEAELRTAHEELQRLTDRLRLAREQERAVIAHRLHDDIAQTLTAVKIDLDMCSRRLPAEVQLAVSPSLGAVADTIDGAISRVRMLCDSLIPAMLDDLGLVPTIEWEAGEFTRRTGIPCTVEGPKRRRRIERRTALLLYRIVQQVLGHVVEPFPATSVRIVLSHKGATTVLQLSATGHGQPQRPTAAQAQAMVGDLHQEIAFRGGTFEAYGLDGGEMVMHIALPSTRSK